MLAELTAVVDALPPELPGLATHKPKPPAKPTPPPRHLIGTEGSVVYGHFDEDLDCWIYHSIGPAGITPSCSTIHAAKSAYKTLAENQRG
ncbi:MAG: hypothetical protein U0X20_17290 [Caldilineaceae bacterium]